MPYANTGKILEVDLGAGRVENLALPETWYGRYIGGSGLAARYFIDQADFSAAALAPEARLIIMNGPFAGLRLAGASRCSIAGRSPLTGHWGDSSCGGYLAPELRYAGYDGLVLRGRAQQPCLLIIEDNRARLEPAGEYWGRPVDEVNAALKERYGPRYRNLVIGPAGERQIPYAVILSENHHAFGRAGFGAVMGSKNLKAIVVHGSRRQIDPADEKGLRPLLQDLNQRIRGSLAADLLRANGTAANLEGGMYAGDVPIRNFTSNFNEEMGAALNGDMLSEKYLLKRHACAFCGIACKRIIEVKEGPFRIDSGPGPEYETIVAFGSLLDSADLAATCKAGRLCNQLGLDTITAGSTIAWAMEAVERGDLSSADLEGVDLRWGNLAAVIDEVLPAIADRRGRLGRLLALGSAGAACELGRGGEYVIHSKGLEAPMHDPRGGGHGLALTYALSPRGACHVADPMLFIEMGARYWPEIGFEYELEPYSDRDKAAAAVISVAMGGIENSACMCQFADGEISLPEWLELFQKTAGYDWDLPGMIKAGHRVFALKKLLNYRFGLRAVDDVVSRRLLEPPKDGEAAGIGIDFAAMKEEFYRLFELDSKSGLPAKKRLQAIGLEEDIELFPS